MADLFFPLDCGRISWDSTKTQTWETAEEKTVSGRRRTLCQQQLPGWTFAVTFPRLSRQEVELLESFYAHTRGGWKHFYYKDYEYHTVTDIYVPRVDYGIYQCIIPNGYAEPVDNVDKVVLKVGGVVVDPEEYTVDHGVIDFHNPEMTTEVIGSYEYYYKVAFDGALQIKQKFKDLYSVSLKLKVVR